MSTHRHQRIMRHARDYIAHLGTRQEALRRRDRPSVEERMDFTGPLDVDFIAPQASMLTIHAIDGASDLGAYLAELVGAGLEEGHWPNMRLEVRMTVEVLKPPPAVADQFLDG